MYNNHSVTTFQRVGVLVTAVILALLGLVWWRAALVQAADYELSDTGHTSTELTEGPVYGVALGPDMMLDGEPGQTVTYTLAITNTGNMSDTFDLSATGIWTTTLPPMITLSAAESANLMIAVDIPLNAAIGDSDVMTVTAVSQSDPIQTATANLTTTAVVPQPYYQYHTYFAKEFFSTNSTLYMQNISTELLAYIGTFYNEDGTVATTIINDLDPLETQILSAAEIVSLPSGFAGSLVIVSDEPLQSVVQSLTEPGPYFMEKGVSSGNFSDSFGPFYKDIGQISGLMLMNVGDSPATVVIDFYTLDGSYTASHVEAIMPGARKGIVNTNLGQLPNDFVGRAVVTADQPVVGLLMRGTPAQFDSHPGLGDGLPEPALPRIFNHVNEAGMAQTSQLFVANNGTVTTSIDLEFRDEAGLAGTWSHTAVSPGSSVVITSEELSFLDDGLYSVHASSDSQPIVIGEMSYFDDSTTVKTGSYSSGYDYTTAGATAYIPHLMRQDDIFTSFSLLNNASVDNDVTISYYNLYGDVIHVVTDTIQPGFSARYNQLEMPELGNNYIGSAVISGSDVGLLWTVDKYLNAKVPVLSGSKTASSDFVAMGDVLTYTVVLSNSSSTTATAVLSDLLPMPLNYLTGTAQTSDGSPITVTSNAVIWAGEVISGTPITIQFATEVLSAPVGTAITNTAYVDYGINSMGLTAVSHVTGYSLTINDGATHTSVPTVTLYYTWNVNHNITEFQVSNQVAFTGTTSGWQPVDAQNPIYENWLLDTEGDLSEPRTVYIMFRDDSGTEYGPVSDTIIYEPPFFQLYLPMLVKG